LSSTFVNRSRVPYASGRAASTRLTGVRGIRDQLKAGNIVDDDAFDVVYPRNVRLASSVHWTPVDAAMRAARLLASGPDACILDVGSGVGKFCIVAAASVGARVSGVEHRAHLVDIAEQAAERIGVDVQFKRGTLADCDPSEFDGLYFFNPFAENVCRPEDRIDSTVELSEARLERDLADAENFLRAARLGTRVVTYCCFGGRLPDDYVCHQREHRGCTIELWVKTHGLRGCGPRR
jgi:predicted RNA methylase